MKPKIFIYFILLSLIFSCTKDEPDLRLSDYEIPKIEGYYVRLPDGSSIGQVGTPNIKQGNGSNYFNSEYFFVFYPNPTNRTCCVHVKSPSIQETKKLWITQARYVNQLPNSSVDLGMINLDVGGAPLIQKVFNSDHIAIDLRSLAQGYYRIYLKVGEHIYYDNLVIDKQSKY
ncbi:MAG: hypothetical protein JEY97_07645 [Bacteroidales bacterium]|nr:hypothetical protein [Bacteroidales bacterium]